MKTKTFSFVLSAALLATSSLWAMENEEHVIDGKKITIPILNGIV